MSQTDYVCVCVYVPFSITVLWRPDFDHTKSSFSLFSIDTPNSLLWSLWNIVWPLSQYFSQISQAVTTTQTSLTQTTVMETVTMVTTREQILVKHGKDELPPPPPQKKRQILVESELRKRWENIYCTPAEMNAQANC